MRNLQKLLIVPMIFKNKKLDVQIEISTERDHTANLSKFPNTIQRSISRGDLDIVHVTIEARLMNSRIPSIVGDSISGVIFSDENSILEFVQKKGMIDESLKVLSNELNDVIEWAQKLEE